ncbi:hypothetical protein FB451DRAFT_1246432 [Mycena latifolia]|nr:hypothetical protein FB451DRAFT_1246432 [Mycena latifolia]
MIQQHSKPPNVMATYGCTQCGFQLQETRLGSTELASSPVLTPQSNPELLRTRLAELDRQIAHIKAYLSTVAAERQTVKEYLGGIVYPILTIPTELTAKIFVDCLPDHGRVWPSAEMAPLLLVQVCRSWREIALGTGDLWKSADVSFESNSRPYTNVCRILSRWFPRAVGRPLSLTVRCGYSRSDVPPAILTSISTFQTQLGRLELRLPLADFRKLKRIGGSFYRLYHLAISLTDWWSAVGVLFDFDAPSLHKLCLGVGILLPTDAGISPLLTTLEISEPMSFEVVLGLVQRFPQLQHLKAFPDGIDPMHPAEPQIVAQLYSLDFAANSNYLDRIKVPNLQSLGFPLEISSAASFSSLISRSACLLQHLTLYISETDENQLEECFSTVPFLISLKVEADDENTQQIFECLTNTPLLPHLRALMVSTSGPLNYEPVIQMASSRRSTALRTIHLTLEDRDEDAESFEDGAWLPNEIYRGVLATLASSVYIETPDGIWPESLQLFFGRIFFYQAHCVEREDDQVLEGGSEGVQEVGDYGVLCLAPLGVVNLADC